MPRYEWDPALETGYALIDDQHRQLFALANALHETDSGCAPDAKVVGDAVYRLTDYVVEHFADEEGLMAHFGYPGLGLHKMQHEQLTSSTLLLTARYFKGEDVSPCEIAEFLGDWLTKHIEAEDLRAIAFVRERIAEQSG